MVAAGGGRGASSAALESGRPRAVTGLPPFPPPSDYTSQHARRLTLPTCLPRCMPGRLCSAYPRGRGACWGRGKVCGRGACREGGAWPGGRARCMLGAVEGSGRGRSSGPPGEGLRVPPPQPQPRQRNATAALIRCCDRAGLLPPGGVPWRQACGGPLGRVSAVGGVVPETQERGPSVAACLHAGLGHLVMEEPF